MIFGIITGRTRGVFFAGALITLQFQSTSNMLKFVFFGVFFSHAGVILVANMK